MSDMIDCACGFGHTLQYWQNLLTGREARLKQLLEFDAPEVLIDQERTMIAHARREVQKHKADQS